jgi:hypothetical protein
LHLYVADRKTGAPVEKADVALWTDGNSSRRERPARTAWLRWRCRRDYSARGAEPENVWILARHGEDAALVTPWSYGFGPNRAGTI